VFTVAEVRGIFGYADVPYDNADAEAEHQRRGKSWAKVRPPSRGPEVSRWGERLDFEAGLVDRRSVPLVRPDDLSPAAAGVAKGIELLLGLRDGRWDATFTFARRFGSAWTGLPTHQVKAGIAELRQREVIVRVGVARRAHVYRLGTRDEVSRADDERAKRQQPSGPRRPTTPASRRAAMTTGRAT
jgi:hypothetical protein